MPNLTADLAYWIQERYNIKQRRESGLARPWSPDPIFQAVRFCNVHREDDAVTKWIREYWNRWDDAAWRFVLARMVNLPESLAEISGAWVGSGGARIPLELELGAAKSCLKYRRDRGTKVFTSAYTVSTCGKAMDKLDYVFDYIVQAVAEAGEPRFDTCQQALEDLTCIDGLGTFFGGQVIADMKNTVGHPLAKSPDFWTFSTPGPGSLRGLSWYFYGEPRGITAGMYYRAMETCRREVDPLVPSYIPRISDQDFQNCLCEFSKYMKVKSNPKAHVRNKFQGV